MANEAYPDVRDDILPVIPFVYGFEQRIIKTEFENGKESRRLVWQEPRRYVSLNYRAQTQEDLDEIYAFYREKQGPFKRFSFFFPNSETYVKEYCGTPSSDTTQINLPSRGALFGSYTLYEDDVAITSYSFHATSAPDGGDYVEANNTFYAGYKYHWSFQGNLKIQARFDENPIEIQDVKGRLMDFRVNLVGLQAEVV